MRVAVGLRWGVAVQGGRDGVAEEERVTSGETMRWVVPENCGTNILSILKWQLVARYMREVVVKVVG